MQKMESLGATGLRGSNDMEQQRLTAHLVQYLGALGAKPGTLTRSHDRHA